MDTLLFTFCTLNKYMKKILILMIVMMGILLFNNVKAVAFDKFDVEVKINKDGSLEITEKVSYKFDKDQLTNFTRRIPLFYSVGGKKYEIRLADLKIIDKNKNEYKFKSQDKDGEREIIIFDENNIAIQKEYYIKYKVYKAIQELEDQGQLLLSITGSNNLVEVNQARAKIFFPQVKNIDELSYSCKESMGDSENDCLYDRIEFAGEDTVSSIIFVSDSLKKSEEMLINISFPLGEIKENNLIKTRFLIQDYSWIFFLIIFCIIFYAQKARMKVWIKYWKLKKKKIK